MSCSILLNGSRMPVRKNLLRFFHEARKPNACATTYFWIDAICINQSNVAERSQQVAMMSLIYTKAANVLLWLGPAYGESRAGMRAISRPLTDEDMTRIWWKSAGSGIRRMCERGYWSRLWILQELTLARSITVLCGSVQVSWQAFINFLERAQRAPPLDTRGVNLEYQPSLKSPAMSMIHQVAEQAGSISLHDKVLSSAHLRCLDPKDKIYGLLGVVDSASHGITPDYSLSVQSVMHDVLRSHFRVEAPRSFKDVRQRYENLAKAVGVDVRSMFRVEDAVTDSMFLEEYRQDMRDFPLICRDTDEEDDGQSIEPQISLWWALQHRHEPIVRLCLRDYIQAGSMPSSLNVLLRNLDETITRESIHAYRTVEKALELSMHNLPELPLQRRRHDREETRPLLLVDMMLHYTSQAKYSLRFGLSGLDREIDTLKTLRADSRNVSTRHFQGTYVLHVAAALGRTKLLECLIAHADLDVQQMDRQGRHPLSLAIQNEHLEAARILMDSGEASANILARRIVLDEQASATGAFTSSVGAATPVLNLAVAHGDIATIESVLLMPMIDLGLRDEDGHNALHEAIKKGMPLAGRPVLRKLLATEGIDVNAQNKYGETPLHCALRRDLTSEELKFTIGELIAHKDININARAYSGCTPLHYAVRNVAGMLGEESHMDAATKRAQVAVKCLLQHPDIDVLARNGADETPLRAFRNCCGKSMRQYVSRVTSLLVDRGADPRDAVYRVFGPLKIQPACTHCAYHETRTCNLCVRRLVPGRWSS